MYIWISHTCIEKLFELLIWGVSCVQNNNRKRNPSKDKGQKQPWILKWTEAQGWKYPKLRHGGSWLSRLPLTGKKRNCRYVTERPQWYPRIVWGASLDGASYVLSIPPAFKKTRSFTSIQMVHTHAPQQRGWQLRPGRWDEDEDEGKWRWDENENEMKAT